MGVFAVAETLVDAVDDPGLHAGLVQQHFGALQKTEALHRATAGDQHGLASGQGTQVIEGFRTGNDVAWYGKMHDGHEISLV